MLTFSEDDIAIYNKRKQWLALDFLDEKISLFLNPHDLDYFSRLNGLFLSQVKDLRKLNSLNHTLVRDGALSLTKFFWDHPTPKEFHSKLIVNEKLAFLVPKKWADFVYYYRDVDATPRPKAKRNELILIGLIDQAQITPQVNVTDFIAENIKHTVDSYNIRDLHLALYHSQWPSEFPAENDHGHYFHLLKKISTELSVNLHFLPWKDFISRDNRQTYLYDITPYPFYYTDSFAKHKALSLGAKLIPPPKEAFSDEEILHTESLSNYHSLEVFRASSPHSQMAENSKKAFEASWEIIKEEEDNINRDHENYSLLRLCGHELESFARQVCLEKFIYSEKE